MMQKLHKKVMMTLVLVGFIVLSAEANPTLTYYTNETQQQQTSWLIDHRNDAAGWSYSVLGSALTLSGPGPYKLSGSTQSFNVVIAGSCELTIDDLSISLSTKAALVVNNGATLTLLIDEGTSTLQGGSEHAGINVQKGGTLIINKVNNKTDAQCVLNVTGGNDGAGIGGNRNGDCGDITINGGTINATGGNYAAGIGSGRVVGGNLITQSCEVGTIEITGGVVTAKSVEHGALSGTGGAGIGTGLVENGASVTVEGIQITGGTVDATGSSRGAGIGTGEVFVGTLETGHAEATIGSIEISGGQVTAKGGAEAAGIGSGGAHQNTTGQADENVGSIDISGGDVTAEGGEGAAGIGTGVAQGGRTHSTVSSIVISGGTVTATKGANAEGQDIGLATSTSLSTGTTTMESVTVTGGCIAESTTLTNPKTAEDTTTGTAVAVQKVRLQNAGWTPGNEIAISGLEGYGTNDVHVSSSKSVVLYLPGGNYSPEIDGEWYVVTNVVNGASSVVVDGIYCQDGFDGTSHPTVTALNSDGLNILFTFSVPLITGIDFSRWVDSELAHNRFAVLLADTASKLTDDNARTIAGGDTVEGARLIYVDTSEVSQDSAQYVSKDATGSLVTVRVPLPIEALNCCFYRIFVLRN